MAGAPEHRGATEAPALGGFPWGLAVRRPLAVAAGAVAVWLAWSFPVAHEWLAAGLLAYLILLWRFPSAWLVVVPTLLPLLDLTPWSGRIFFNELDLVLLATVAGGLWAKEGGGGAVGHPPGSAAVPGGGLAFSRGAWLLVGLLAVQQAVATAIGLLPLQPVDGNAFYSFYSHYNALRIGKGFFWALALLPMLGQAAARGVSLGRLWSLGMLGGLAAAVLSVVWERALFTGLFDFDTPYRATGLFSGMLTGGAAIDAFLVAALPFVAASVLLWRSALAAVSGLLLLFPALYALLVTFSRIDYPAVGAALVVLIAGWLRLGRGPVSPGRLRTPVLVAILAGVAVLGALALSSGGFIQKRFATTLAELPGRLGHATQALRAMAPDATTSLFGMGKGSFPRAYALRPGGELPSTFARVEEGGDAFLRFGPSGASNLAVRQHFPVGEPGPYRLDVRLRGHRAERALLMVEVCERHILPFLPECRTVRAWLEPPYDQWQDYHVPFQVDDLGKRHWYGARPVEVALMHRGLAHGMDIDDVQVVTPGGARLLRNGDFTRGMDHWVYSDVVHTAWHVKNLWVETFFEGGWTGLLLLLALQGYLVVRLWRRIGRGDALALLLLASLAGLWTVGVADSLVDEPRLALVFYLMTWLAMARAEPAVVPATGALSGRVGRAFSGLARRYGARLSSLSYRALPPPVRPLVLGGLSLVGLAAVFVGLQRHYDMSPAQVLVRLAEKAGVDHPGMVRLLSPSPRTASHALDGRIRPAHPRILLPGLAAWDGRGVPPLLAERVEAYRRLGIEAPSPCQSEGLLALAACWVATGEAARAEELIRQLREAYLAVPGESDGNVGNGYELAIAYDLARTYRGWGVEDRAIVEGKIARSLRHALILLDDDEMSLWHGRATLAAAAWLSAVVLEAGEPAGDPGRDLGGDAAREPVRGGMGDRDSARDAMVARAQGHFLEVLRALALTEGWPEGYFYWINSRGRILALAASAYLNGLEGQRNAEAVRALLSRVGRWHIYAMRPDQRAQGFGDEGPRVDLIEETRPVVDLLAQASRDPALATYSDYLGKVLGRRSYHRDHLWGFWLFNDPGLERLRGDGLQALDGVLPRAALFGPNALNQVFIRSDWGPDATYVTFRAGDTFAHHGHYDAGHFTLFKGAPLAINSGTYGEFFSEHRLDYAIRSVAKDTLLVLRPGERVPVGGLSRRNGSGGGLLSRWSAAVGGFLARRNVADGGQRVVLPTGSAVRSVADWLSNLGQGQHLEGGDVVHFTHRDGELTHVAADLTPAYNTPGHDEGGSGGKVRRVLRQLVYLAEEDRLIVYDQVTTTDPSYTKKWLLHTVQRPEAEGLRVLAGAPENGILETGADRARVQNGRGHLLVRRFLPEDGRMRLVGGPDYRYYVEADGDDSDLDGRNVVEGANEKPWFDLGQWRIELQPGVPRASDEFLVVLTPGLDGAPADDTELVQTDEGGAAVDAAERMQTDVDAAQRRAEPLHSGAGGARGRVGGRLRGIATPTSVVFFADSGWERETQLGEHAAQPGEREAVFQMPPGRQRLYLLGLPPGGAVQLQHAGGSVPITVDPDGLAKMEMGTFCITCGPSAPRLFSIRWGGS